MAAIEDPPVIVIKILSHLGLGPNRAPPRAPAQRFDLLPDNLRSLKTVTRASTAPLALSSSERLRTDFL